MLSAGLLLATRGRPDDGPIARWRLILVVSLGAAHGLLVGGLWLHPWWGSGQLATGLPVLNDLLLTFLAPALLLAATARARPDSSDRWTRGWIAAAAVFALLWAVTVKLVRVSLLALVVAAVAFAVVGAARDSKAQDRKEQGQTLSRAALLPGFVIAFFAFAALRSTGAVPAEVLPAATFASNLLIGAGVVAVGAKTSISGLRSMGWRPLAALACQTLLLCGLAFGAARLLTA